jgi:pyridinium-3,5-biscarboxylic acid mononucleotide sulfurtransferase
MNDATRGRYDVLNEVLGSFDRAAVAVSGGVDSLTLATLAGRLLGGRVRMYHAVSPAVPPEATERVRALAGAHGWQLDVIDAGEFSRPDYVANPVNRCFHCKTSLYSSIVPRAGGATVLSGTNLDDLGEYRPGLRAAEEHGVRHPFVEASVDKGMVRAIAGHLGLGDIADLPAAPCLSSRVETGIPIRPEILAGIHRAERLVAQALSPKTVRARYRADGVVVELDAGALSRLTASDRPDLERGVAACFGDEAGTARVRFEPYRNGSAFLVKA